MPTSLLKPTTSYTSSSAAGSAVSLNTSPSLVSSSGVTSSLSGVNKNKTNVTSLLQSFASSSNVSLASTSSSSSTQLQPTQILVKDLKQSNQKSISTQRQMSCPSSIPTLTLPSSNNSKLLLVTTSKQNKGQDISSQVAPSSTFILNSGDQMSSQLQISNTISLPNVKETKGLLTFSR